MAHRTQMTIVIAVIEDCLKRIAGKTLKLEIGPGEGSAALRGSPFYRKESVELRVDLVPDLIDFDTVLVGPSQVSCEMTHPFGQIIGRKLTIYAATSDSALVRGHTDDRAALISPSSQIALRQRMNSAASSGLPSFFIA